MYLFFFFNYNIDIIFFINKFDIISIYENIISILYPGYSLLYRLIINLNFFFKYIYNIWLRYLLTNNLGLFINRIIKIIIYYLWFMDKWLNRRFFHRTKKWRLYFRLPNIRFWKFLLIFYMFFIFFTMWKNRNLHLKTKLITKPFGFYILVLFLCAPIKYIIGINFISTFLVINVIFFFFYINR